MATMYQNGDQWRIQGVYNGARYTLRMGGGSKLLAEAFKTKFIRLANCYAHADTVPAEVSGWFRKMDIVLQKRIAAIVPEAAELMQRKAGATLGELSAKFMPQVKGLSVTAYATYVLTRDNLQSFFGKDCPLAEITRARADEFRVWMDDQTGKRGENQKRKLAEATIARRIVAARTIFTKAQRWGMIEGLNPFAGVKSGRMDNPKRREYIPPERVLALMDKLPQNLRTIMALARFAALRIPSEPAGLAWGDINFETKRMTVYAPKTKTSRIVPISPEVERELIRWQLEAPEGVQVFPGLSGDTNLRKLVDDAARKANIPLWSKLFHQLRGSCESDWAQVMPPQSFAAITGHNPQTALTHYLSVRESDYDAVTRGITKPATPAPAPEKAEETPPEKRDVKSDVTEPKNGVNDVKAENENLDIVGDLPQFTSNDSLTCARQESNLQPSVP